MTDTRQPVKRTGIRSSTTAALPYRHLNPGYFLTAGSVDEATIVVAGWRAEKITENMPIVPPDRAENYEKRAKLLIAKYAREIEAEAGDMNPVDIVRCLLNGSESIRKNTWMGYRKYLMWYFNNEIVKADALNRARNSYTKALGKRGFIRRYRPTYFEA